MSHYLLGVIVKNLDELESALAPFNENLEVEPYVIRTTEELIAEAKEDLKEYEPSKKPNEYEEKLLKCVTDEDFLKAYIDYYWKDKEKFFDDKGNELSTYNPNSKWDWWVASVKKGRSRFISSEMPTGYCKVKDLTLAIDKEEYEKLIRYWELVVEEQELKEGEEKPLIFYKKEYYIEQFGTKENFAYMRSLPTPYALLVDGKWYAEGQMGGWGIDKSTKEKKEFFLETYKQITADEKYQDYYIIFVDCHI